MIDWNIISDIAAQLPNCVEGTSYGTPAFRAGTKLVMRVHQTEDVFVLRVDSTKAQAELIESDPAIFYITDHYNGYPWVLVRPSVDEDIFRELFIHAWRLRASNKDIQRYESGGEN